MNKINLRNKVMLITLILFFPGATHIKGAEVIEYFWPLQIGKRFIYQIEDFTKHITIKSISKEKSGDIKVETEEVIKAFGKVIENKNVYIISVDKGIISRGEKEKVILLKSPIRKGVKWRTIFYKKSFDVTSQKQKNKEKLKKRKGMCQIEKIENEEILDSIQSCVTVLCAEEGDKSTQFEMVFCKKIGYVGFKLSESDEWIEKLVDIR